MEVSEDAELHKPKGQGPTLKSIFKGVSSALLFSSHRSDETVHNKSDLSEPLLEEVALYETVDVSRTRGRPDDHTQPEPGAW